MSQEFNSGQTVYLDDGAEAYYLGKLGDGHAVELALYEDGRDWNEGPVGSATVMRAPRVWAKPPVANKAAEVAALEERVQALKKEERAARERIRTQEQEAKARHAELTKWAGLKTLEDFLAGRITHVVIVSYGAPRISGFDEAVRYIEDNKRQNGFKLLTLFGRSNGEMEWGLNRYYDGSGSDETIYPATSLEEALTIVARLRDAAMEGFRAKTGYMHGFNYWVDSGAALGFDLPADLMARWHADSIRSAEENIAKAAAELEAKRAALGAMKAKALPASPSIGGSQS